MKEFSRNSSGYADPTANVALSGTQNQQDENDRRLKTLLKCLFFIIDAAGYDLLCRIELRDRSTGRCYR